MRAYRPSLLAFLLLFSSAVQAAAVIDVYKNENCGCCGEWVTYLRRNGFEVRTHAVDDTAAYRRKAGLSDELGSCHTAMLVDTTAKGRRTYVIEGHVPAREIRRLLRESPDALGLAVPGMPEGSPGMEGARRVPYEVLLVRRDGRFVTYQKY